MMYLQIWGCRTAGRVERLILAVICLTVDSVGVELCDPRWEVCTREVGGALPSVTMDLRRVVEGQFVLWRKQGC